jgi:SOUL heme-binding protein
MEPAAQKLDATSQPESSAAAAAAESATMAFILPNKYKAVADVPRPKNEQVKIREEPAAVSGWWMMALR